MENDHDKYDSKAIHQEMTEHKQPSRKHGVPRGAEILRSLFQCLYFNGDSIASKHEHGPQGLTLLHSPPTATAHLIFVHGLRGGSYRSWSGGTPGSVWPRDWLPQDVDFATVRISTFGYACDWTESDSSVLSVHDFGSHLFAELSSSPQVRQENTPVILVGHSMGGLVIKKAYNLSCQDPHSTELAGRIRAIIFLATPHRGSDSAKVLNRVLRASGALKSLSYVGDLQRNSSSLQAISDEFKMYADSLVLWSFYEAHKTRLGLRRKFIVGKDSATLGYKNEQSIYLNADHRGTSRFGSKSDANYALVRNTLVRAIARITAKVQSPSISKEKASEQWSKPSGMRALSSYLGDPESCVDDLLNLEEAIGQETCRWLGDKKEFQYWLHNSSNARTLYWLTSKPGTGKSVLAAYTIRQLRSSGCKCSFYFFKHGDRVNRSASSFVRSLAYQLAALNPEISKLLLSMSDDDIPFNRDDCRAIWRTLFSGKILDTPLDATQYVVIDGLDECADAPTIMNLLGKIESKFPIRILITSLPTLGFSRYFETWGNDLMVSTISPEETLHDIRIFVENEANHWSILDIHERARLVDKILAKSEGCFLWVRLVLREITPGLSEQQIDIILDSVPAEMESVYSRSLEKIASTTREKDVAHSILTWVVCAFRPMGDKELQHAIFYDTGKNVYGFDASVESQYGHLVSYRQNSRTVEIVHSTAREYLLKNESKEFPITRSSGHLRLATVCLKYLTSDEMRPLRHPSQTSMYTNAPKSPFADYACTTFSEHLVHAPSAGDELLVLLSTFLKSNVLTWIEYVVQHHSLYYLILAGKNLRRYLERRAKHSSPLGVEFQTVSGWATDFIRLVARFGHQLLDFPGAIHFLVPPFCPTESFVYRQFGNMHGAVKVEGSHREEWEDCVAWVEYRNSWAMSLACGDNVFALGMKTGDILVYNQSTCQHVYGLQHEEPVKVIKFDSSGHWMASAGARSVKLWDTSGEKIWSFPLDDPCVAMSFTQDSRKLLVATRANRGIELDTDAGRAVRDHQFTGSSGILSSTRHQAPMSASISPDQSILALVYRGRPVHLWSLQGDTNLIGFCGRDVGKETPGISAGAALFNPNPNINLLAVSYQDGELALYDPWSQKELASVDGSALSLASSPDGRTLATGDGHGTIQLWDFETLTLLYRMSGCEEGLEKLAFSSDGFRVMDIRYTVTQVWEPPALVRKDCEEDSSASDLAQLPVPSSTLDTSFLIDVVAIAPHLSQPVIFAAKSDGTVVYFDCTSGKEVRKLYSHPKGLSATKVVWNATANILVSADNEGRVLGRCLEECEGQWTVATTKLNLKAECTVQQLLLNSDGSLLLVSAGSYDTLWRIPDVKGRPQLIGRVEFSQSQPRTWAIHPDNSTQLLLLVDSEFRVFKWDSLKLSSSFPLPSRTESGHEFKLTTTAQAQRHLLQSRSVSDNSTAYLIAGLVPVENQLSSFPFYAWDSSALTGGKDQTGIGSQSAPRPISLQGVRYVLGLRGSRLVFLDDDFWVCTYDLAALKDEPGHQTGSASHKAKVAATAHGDVQRQRHFFVPSDFATRTSGITASLTGDGGIAFARRGQVIILRCEWGMLEK